MNSISMRTEWRKIGEFLLVFTIIPTIAFSIAGYYRPNILKFSYYFIITLFVVQACLSYLQSFGAFFRKRFPRAASVEHHDIPPIPKATFIICAFLPNEIDVIEETLLNVLDNVQRPADGIEVILSYNTPHMMGIEPRLRELAAEYPELILANAYGSHSKSENLNYALDIASGEMIALLDADHIVASDCLERAWRWLATGEDVVQGRCRIRNGSDNVLTAMVEVEFDTIYGVSHYARSLLFHTAIFAGSDAYWKAAPLKELRFRTDMLTEDIDATLRAILDGKRVLHDRSILSRELAPNTFTGFWFQRKRWGQGWFQCSVRYQWKVLKSRSLGIGAKFMWTSLLMWRVVYDALCHLLFPVLFGYWISRWAFSLPMTPYIWFSLIFTLASGPVEALTAFKNAAPHRPPVRRLLLFVLLVWPYTLLKNMIHMIAIREELIGSKEWVISPRQAPVTEHGKDSG